MKTKLILHGGFKPGQTEEDNSKFYNEILKDAPEGAKVLLVCFAKDTERVAIATTKVMVEFNRNKWQKEIAFDIASEESFAEQVKSADVIYLHGGRTLKLLDTLKRFPNLRELFDRKIIAGESAGANVLGKFCYSPRADEVIECLGILPIKIIPHYSEEFRNKLDGVGQELETLFLSEYQFKILFSK